MRADSTAAASCLHLALQLGDARGIWLHFQAARTHFRLQHLQLQLYGGELGTLCRQTAVAVLHLRFESGSDSKIRRHYRSKQAQMSHRKSIRISSGQETRWLQSQRASIDKEEMKQETVGKSTQISNSSDNMKETILTNKYMYHFMINAAQQMLPLSKLNV